MHPQRLFLLYVVSSSITWKHFVNMLFQSTASTNMKQQPFAPYTSMNAMIMIICGVMCVSRGLIFIPRHTCMRKPEIPVVNRSSAFISWTLPWLPRRSNFCLEYITPIKGVKMMLLSWKILEINVLGLHDVYFLVKFTFPSGRTAPGSTVAHFGLLATRRKWLYYYYIERLFLLKIKSKLSCKKWAI